MTAPKATVPPCAGSCPIVIADFVVIFVFYSCRLISTITKTDDISTENSLKLSVISNVNINENEEGNT
jgi:hypothetical protein